MGEGIGHIISPLSAPWCGWTMLVLLFCAFLAEHFQPGIISQSPSSLRTRTERIYKDAPVDVMGQILIAIFRIGTLGMAIYFCLYAGHSFSFVHYCMICGMVLGILLVKMLCNTVLDYTFMLTRRAETPYEHYGNIATLAVLVLYAALLVLLKAGSEIACRWTVGIITILFVLVWTYRSWRLFVDSPKAILYLVIYIGTLEVLPLGLLYYLSDKMITIL